MNQLQVIIHNNQRVLTTAQLAESFGTETKIISKNFERNEERYTEGKHFYILQGQELKDFKATRQIDDNLKFAPILYLWTEKGAWMHAKSLNTDRAWEAYEMLVDEYYRVKESLDTSKLSPELQMFNQMFTALAQVELGNKEMKKTIGEVKETVEVIQDTFLKRDDNWRKYVNGLLNGAAKRMNHPYRNLRNKSYDMLEDRGKCRLKIRLENMKDRLEKSGATQTRIEKLNRMDVIEADPHLKEIYTSIVKEISIGSMKGA